MVSYIKIGCIRLKLLFAIFSGLLLGLFWPPNILSYPYFVVFVPLFWVADRTENSRGERLKFLLYPFLSFIIWHVITLHWLFNLSTRSAILVVVINSIIYSIPFILFTLYPKIRFLFFIVSWVALEYLIQKWELGFPYMILGNALSTRYNLIQWYEVTGVIGGSFWIILVNICIYFLIKDRYKKLRIIEFIASVIIPIGISYLLYSKHYDTKKINIGYLHTSVDSRTTRYQISQDSLISIYLSDLSSLNENVSAVFLPESSLPEGGWLSELKNESSLKILRNIASSKDFDVVSGIIFHSLVDGASHPLSSATSEGSNFITHTGSISVNSNGNSYFRVKNKLVPFEETIPYPTVLSFLRRHIPSLGGFVFSKLALTNEVFKTSDGIKYIYLVCYESLFPEFTRRRVLEGAEFIAIGLNESWYSGSIASNQMMYYSIGRAIENRRTVVRSSNDGISCVISPLGSIVSSYQGSTHRLITHEIPIRKVNTVYTLFGDWLGLLCLISCVMILSWQLLIVRF